MKKKKINWINIIKVILFLVCIVMIIQNIYMLTIHTWITHTIVGFSWFGLIMFIFFCSIAGCLYDNLESQIKKTSTIRNNSQR